MSSHNPNRPDVERRLADTVDLLCSDSCLPRNTGAKARKRRPLGRRYG